MRKRDIWKVPIAIGWLMGLSIANIFCGSRPSPEKLERKKRHQRSDSPEPLPARRRALTLLLGSLDTASSQQLSLFFTKLPPDVRYLIYQHVLRASGRAYLHVPAPTGGFVASHAMSPATSMAGSIYAGGMQQLMEQPCHALQ